MKMSLWKVTMTILQLEDRDWTTHRQENFVWSVKLKCQDGEIWKPVLRLVVTYACWKRNPSFDSTASALLDSLQKTARLASFFGEISQELGTLYSTYLRLIQHMQPKCNEPSWGNNFKFVFWLPHSWCSIFSVTNWCANMCLTIFLLGLRSFYCIQHGKSRYGCTTGFFYWWWACKMFFKCNGTY